jgi:hypothetical protein
MKLISLRKEIPSLHSRSWRLLEAGPAEQVLAYLRYLEGNTEPVLIILNFSEEPAQAAVGLPEEFSPLLTGSLTDRLNDEDIPFTGKNLIQMNPMSARILTVKKEA